MKKRAQAILDNEIKKLLTAPQPEIFHESLSKLTQLAGLLDSMGNEVDADHVDSIIKEAASIWDFLLGGVGGAATTKEEGGKSILDALKSNSLGDFFSKDALVRIITRFLLGGGIGVLSAELVEVLTQKVPILKWFGDSKFIKMAIEGALSYAVMNSDFVSKLVDGIVTEFEKFVDMKKEHTRPEKPATTFPVPTTKPQLISQKDTPESDTAKFPITLPGVKL